MNSEYDMDLKRRFSSSADEDGNSSAKRVKCRLDEESGINVWKSLYSSDLPPELLALCSPHKCHLCHDLPLTSNTVAKQHYLGRPHAKQTDAFLLEWAEKCNKKRPFRLMENADLVEVTVDNFCSVCQILLTSKVVAEMHFAGKSHLKEIRKAKQLKISNLVSEMRQEIDNAKGDDEPAGGQNDGGDNDEERNQFKYFCLPCNIDFPDLCTYQTHVYSAQHKVKVSADENVEESRFLCEICRIQFSSEEAKNAHLESTDHKLKQIRSQSDDQADYDDDDRVYYENLSCDLCKVAVNSADVMKSHLMGKQHKKKKKIAEEQNSQNGNDLNSVFRCELCNVSATSDVHLRDHLKGKKHLKKVKTQT